MNFPSSAIQRTPVSTCTEQGSAPLRTVSDQRTLPEIWRVLKDLASWMKARDYAGYEPYDLLNSPLLAGRWARRFPCNTVLIQLGKRFGGLRLRQLLRIPPSKNPKALALILSGYCDWARCGEDTEAEARYLKRELLRLRSPGEPCYCWGYDWDFVALRGTSLPAFRPNAIASYFAGTALLDMHDTFGDPEARRIAESVGEFVVTRLNRSVDTPSQLCFSYTPSDRTRIYNSSALVGAFLARLTAASGNASYLQLARQAMQYLADAQQPDGSWPYGEKWYQKWADSFHTGYNLVALLTYRLATEDRSFDTVLLRGYEDYRRSFFLSDGTPKYFHNSLYPIDIHSCAQAILTFCAFSREDTEARGLAIRTWHWTFHNMRNSDGSFFFQRRRWRADRTPYMRWGQAWTFRALAALLAADAQDQKKR